jgi:hypothetical protein
LHVHHSPEVGENRRSTIAIEGQHWFDREIEKVCFMNWWENYLLEGRREQKEPSWEKITEKTNII